MMLITFPRHRDVSELLPERPATPILIQHDRVDSVVAGILHVRHGTRTPLPVIFFVSFLRIWLPTHRTEI